MQAKRLRKSKAHPTIEKDRTRGRYACLGHRMKHKRCPLDCPERRPKPNNQEQEPITTSSSSSLVQIKKESITSKPRLPRSTLVAKKHVLQLEDCNLVSQVPHSTVPAEREASHWDSVEWEGLGWDTEQVCLKETEAWMDLKSSSHWEESKSLNLVSEDIKPMDDLTKYEEDEIVDSWLNDDGFGNSVQDYESAERNEGGEGNISEIGSDTSGHYTNIEQLLKVLPKILVTRDMLERWLKEPYFNRLVQGCFVRVRIGEYLETPVYRIASIDQVRDSCFFNYNLNQSQTTKGLALQVGDSSKVFPIDAISNQPPTESDIRNWQEDMEKSNIDFDRNEVLQKEEIVRVLASKYPEFSGGPQDVEPMINEPSWNC